MIRIDHIRMRLPHSRQTQATLFANHLADALARLEFSKSVDLKSLTLPPVKIEHNQNVNEIASQMANEIHHLIEGGRI